MVHSVIIDELDEDALAALRALAAARSSTLDAVASELMGRALKDRRQTERRTQPPQAVDDRRQHKRRKPAIILPFKDKYHAPQHS